MAFKGGTRKLRPAEREEEPRAFSVFCVTVTFFRAVIYL